MANYRRGLSQSLGMRQELKINPRLYQAMDLLYMPLLDLQAHLKQEVLVNPFLEFTEMAEEEKEHVTLMEEWLARYPASDAPPIDDPDPPVDQG